MDSVLVWIEAHQGSAAWVQAIGTLVALALTLGSLHEARRTAERQFREARERETRDRLEAARERERQVSAITQAAFAAAGNLVNGMRVLVSQMNDFTSDQLLEFKSTFKVAIDAFEGDFEDFPIYLVGDFTAISKLNALRTNVRAFKSALGVMMDEPAAPVDMTAAKKAVAVAERIQEELAKRMLELEGKLPDPLAAQSNAAG